MKHSKRPWWRDEVYDINKDIPYVFTANAGPKGVALVDVYDEGKTTSGWGSKTFMENYMNLRFRANTRQHNFVHGFPFAFIMRSVKLVCVDIDYKNGGEEGARSLVLPPTLAETSKSGNGYHLFYLTEDTWDDNYGFRALPDALGFVTGVDFRAVGCVYHYVQQRWNNRPPEMLPSHISDLLNKKAQLSGERMLYVQQVLASNDDTEVLMLHDQLLKDLAKPIPDGRRNSTLFAIGSQLRETGFNSWQTHIEERGLQIGLDPHEVDKIIRNIEIYRTP